AVTGPKLVGRRCDKLKRHLDAAGIFSLVADEVQQANPMVLRRWRVEAKRPWLEIRAHPGEFAVFPDKVDAQLFQFLPLEPLGQRLAWVDEKQSDHAAARPAGGNADQPPGRLQAEIDGEIGDNEHSERLGNLAGLGVVFGDTPELVAEVFLDDVF